ncbi:amidohydrolase family protein [Tepidanaerobacter sp. EBM-49]|uniref:amidohydrolase family protein n=1 Tax=Tepidanaerobacter sp. EBM-49 TaxID=1918504 RepID=UPI000A7AEE6E|nr:amidohydrolase family protein [Tepidanaerobacter sp. EBM-49]
MFDYALLNGYVVDPKNKIASKLNIGIKDGKIAALTIDEIEGENNIDCSDLTISPGFVDIHMHEDSYDEKKKDFSFDIADCMLKMGVTSAVGGNCGSGPKHPEKYLNEADRLGYPINIGLLSAHGNLRSDFGNFDKYKGVGKDVIYKMSERLEFELESGTLGLSFGIRYIPGVSSDEMAALSQTVKKYDRIVAAHIRDDADKVAPSIMELINIAKDTGIKVQVSHIGSMAAYGQMEQALQIIDYHSGTGINIGIDCYPYNAFCTSIGSTTFDDGFLERYGIDYSALEITQGEYKGQRLNEASFKKERENHPDYLVVAHVMRDSEVDKALSHPKTIVASDGILNNGNGHPRAAGTFPRFIREYVINKKLVSLNEAIAKMTYIPAERFGIDKGTLSIGADADITVFDIEKIRDTATFENPTLPPDGIDYVLIGGRMALAQGKIINRRLGCAIRA